MMQVDRAHYAPSRPYEDSPQGIGHAATISAPHMHASAVDHLLDRVLPSEASPAPRVLDIGSGSGYLTHVLAELVGDKGTVLGVEHIEALRALGEANMSRSDDGRAFLASGRAKFRKGDGRKGWVEPDEDLRAEEGGTVERRGKGWDAIHVGAAAREVHAELVEQLRAPGRMFIPVDSDEDGEFQYIWTIDKDAEGKVTRKKMFGVRYVPLTDAPKDS
jgi:protein-L-isoaspartate(D-aspartate) O-methyltransferase